MRLPAGASVPAGSAAAVDLGGGVQDCGELSQALKCTPRNVTGLVDALEAAGFVARSAHPTDRRATVVSLTQGERPSSPTGTATATTAPATCSAARPPPS
ncbi:MarR family transcriptional regulator [Plantactinospora sp. ZYX-F-223]|uniref:MarR family winged helix-turn-helix transcriptional regulator n=1 Tax=Plantactinospora sp. ZYX-F-223 TaxID=3144103 RepID=UPI0031FE0E0B